MDKEIKHEHEIALSSLGMQARKDICGLTGLSFSSLVGIAREAKGWCVSVEIVEKHTIPDSLDLLGFVELHYDEAGKLLTFERKGMRSRSSMEMSI